MNGCEWYGRFSGCLSLKSQWFDGDLFKQTTAEPAGMIRVWLIYSSDQRRYRCSTDGDGDGDTLILPVACRLHPLRRPSPVACRLVFAKQIKSLSRHPLRRPSRGTSPDENCAVGRKETASWLFACTGTTLHGQPNYWNVQRISYYEAKIKGVICMCFIRLSTYSICC